MIDKTIQTGDKVVFNGKIYDFGYWSTSGHAIIYDEGECNIQNSYSIKPDKIYKLIPNTARIADDRYRDDKSY